MQLVVPASMVITACLDGIVDFFAHFGITCMFSLGLLPQGPPGGVASSEWHTAPAQ
jgi:hypothetical protein